MWPRMSAEKKCALFKEIGCEVWMRTIFWKKPTISKPWHRSIVPNYKHVHTEILFVSHEATDLRVGRNILLIAVERLDYPLSLSVTAFNKKSWSVYTLLLALFQWTSLHVLICHHVVRIIFLQLHLCLVIWTAHRIICIGIPDFALPLPPASAQQTKLILTNIIMQMHVRISW